MKTVFDLEDRCFNFARDVRLFIKNIGSNLINVDDIKQLIKASGSIGANYIEANDALGKKDFLMRLRISRKEAKETEFWLRLIIECNEIENYQEAKRLQSEVRQLRNILSAIIIKSN